MKVALPIDGTDFDATVVEHFGRAQNFFVYDFESGEFEVHANPEAIGEDTLPPKFLSRQGVLAVICFGLGQKAVEWFRTLDIVVFKAEPGSVVDNIQKFEKRQLSKLY